MHIQDDLTEQELAYLLERFRQMATLLTGDPAAEAECSYCRRQMELGEALLTANLSGVLAHLRCPKDALDRVLEHARPDPGFDLAGFLDALDERMGRPGLEECSGEIDVPWSPGTHEDDEAESEGGDETPSPSSQSASRAEKASQDGSSCDDSSPSE